MHFSPAVRPQLLRLIDALDDGTRGIASIWRELGHVARARRLFQPSYETVRRLVHAQRERRRVTSLWLRRVRVLAAEQRVRPRVGVGLRRPLPGYRRAMPRGAA